MKTLVFALLLLAGTTAAHAQCVGGNCYPAVTVRAPYVSVAVPAPILYPAPVVLPGDAASSEQDGQMSPRLVPALQYRRGPLRRLFFSPYRPVYVWR